MAVMLPQVAQVIRHPHFLLTPTGREDALLALIRSLKPEAGATAIEYAFIAGLISIAAIVAFNTIGTNLSSTFGTVAGSL